MLFRFWKNKDIQKTKVKLAHKEELRQLKAEHKLNKKQNKYEENKKKSKIKEKTKWFNFFTKWFYGNYIFRGKHNLIVAKGACSINAVSD